MLEMDCRYSHDVKKGLTRLASESWKSASDQKVSQTGKMGLGRVLGGQNRA